MNSLKIHLKRLHWLSTRRRTLKRLKRSARHLGYDVNILDPRTFNEKVLHRKYIGIYPRFTELSDKYKVRDYVACVIGEKFLNPVYQVIDNKKQIDFDELPKEFVIKSNNDSGTVHIIRDKNNYTRQKIMDLSDRLLRKRIGRAYWYREIEPKVIFERLILQEDGGLPNDYKFYVFNGRVEAIHVGHVISENPQRVFYDRKWNVMPFRMKHPSGRPIDKPSRLGEMMILVEKLAQPFDFVRVDLYHPTKEEILFGEMTFSPAGGTGRFDPVEYDFKFGDLWRMTP